MIKTVTHKFPMRVASGKMSILKLCKDHGFAIELTDNNLLVLQDELIDPRYDVVLVQTGVDYVEFDVLSKAEYAANYDTV
tara:strand:+ start:144 stop:383 length:240 start_codon:yes stop_codon:yes gene_type:complete